MSARVARSRVWALLLVVVLAAAIAPNAVQASHLPVSYCAPSGAYCTKTAVIDGVRTFRIASTDLSGRYRLCVVSPDGVRACKDFRMTTTDTGKAVGVVRWREHFQHNGPGSYRVSWRKWGNRLGPVLGFHVKPPTAPGVTATTIKIGIHAPLTGAAPLPSQSFTGGKDQYWRAGHKVAGREVRVVLRDDKSNPSSASDACRDLISNEKVFLLIGSGGTDEVAECARIANAAGVPYVSAGATELRLDELASYFALSKSYSQQMPLLMQYINSAVHPANGKVGLIASNTANFDDAVAAFQNAAKAKGFTPVIYRPSKHPSDSELAALAQRVATDEITVATPLLASTNWIKLASNPQVRNIQWHGVGMTQGLNSVASAVCQSSGGAVDGATFFSPWPGRNLAKSLSWGFGAAGGGDDVQWSLWGLNKTLHAAFKKMDGTLTRRAFAKAMTGDVRSGIYPNLRHTEDDHFRAREVHQVQLDCGVRRFKSTEQTIFRTSFSAEG